MAGVKKQPFRKILDFDFAGNKRYSKFKTLPIFWEPKWDCWDYPQLL